MVEVAERSRAWRHASGSLRLDPAVVMAVLNVTPDSFHDGGALSADGRVDISRVRAAATAAIEAGARVLDIGGESTRPGAKPVDPDAEWHRVVPVVEALVSLGVPISVDTRRASVARGALEAGAVIVNDVSGLSDPEMAATAAEFDAGLVIGHLRGQPESMQATIDFDNLLADVARELKRSLRIAENAGVSSRHILVDPGVGFGKTPEQSAALVALSDLLEHEVGVPVMIGASRKSFIGAFSPSTTAERLPGSVCAAVLAVRHGAAAVRVHDVAETVQGLRVASAIEAARTRFGGGAS